MEDLTSYKQEKPVETEKNKPGPVQTPGGQDKILLLIFRGCWFYYPILYLLSGPLLNQLPFIYSILEVIYPVQSFLALFTGIYIPWYLLRFPWGDTLKLLLKIEIGATALKFLFIGNLYTTIIHTTPQVYTLLNFLTLLVFPVIAWDMGKVLNDQLLKLRVYAVFLAGFTALNALANFYSGFEAYYTQIQTAKIFVYLLGCVIFINLDFNKYFKGNSPIK